VHELELVVPPLESLPELFPEPVVVVGVGVVVWLPLLLLLLFELAGEDDVLRNRNGTMKAPIPATIKAMAPILRLVRFILV